MFKINYFDKINIMKLTYKDKMIYKKLKALTI
jgi:hypothetical protein